MRAIDPEIVQRFLQINFDARACDVTLIGAGMFSQAFTFMVARQKFIVRVSACVEDFQKDALAHEHFASPGLPIPKVIRIDPFDETRFFCITEFCSGRTLRDTHNADDLPITPQLFDTLDAIHSIDVSTSSGYGLANANGNGRFDSWQESLLALYNQKFNYDYKASFFEQNVFDEFFQALQQLLPACPHDRYLIHRDFGFDNVVADGARVTGVLDWAEFGYGDFLYDIAYLDYFSQQIPYGDLWLERAQTQGHAVPNFQARMQCYMLNIGLHDMAIAATLKREQSYIRGRERTRSVLSPSRRAPTDWTQ